MGSPVPKDTSTSQLLHLWFREHGGREGRKMVKARIQGSLQGNNLSQKLLHKPKQNNGNLSGHINTGEGSVPGVPPLDKELQAVNDCWEENYPPPGPSFPVQCRVIDQYRKNIHTTNKNRLIRLYLYTFVYTHSYAYNKVEKRLSTWGVRGGQEEVVGMGWREKKEKGIL